MDCQRIVPGPDGQQRLLFYTGWSPFSNFYVGSFTVDGIRYHSAEQYYQAKKAYFFNDQSTYYKILRCQSPRKSRELGGAVKNYSDEVWNPQRYATMYEAVSAKFTNNPDLKTRLLASKNLELVYATHFDNYLATGLHPKDPLNQDDYPGQNILGKMLTKLRETLN